MLKSVDRSYTLLNPVQSGDDAEIENSVGHQFDEFDDYKAIENNGVTS